jgi:multiple sugar transport system permease protein
MSTVPTTQGKKKINWAPYLLILPSLVYLAVFFAWPMVRGLTLAVWDDEARLSLQVEATAESDTAGTLPQGTTVDILDQQGNKVPLEDIKREIY